MSEDGVGFTRGNAVVFREVLWSWAKIEMTKAGPLLARSVRPIAGCSARDQHSGARLAQILDLLAEDNRLNVNAGELEVRPPAAPTTKRGSHEREPDDLSQSFS